MQIFKTCFLSSQNYLCIGEHTLCPFFKAAFLWLQTIDMDAFDNNVVESYKMSKSIFCCNLSVEKYWSAGRFDTHQSKISSVVAWKRSM